MDLIVYCFLLLNVGIGLIGYLSLYRLRYLFSERFGFIVAITASNIVSLVVSMNVFFIFSEQATLISCLNIFLGVATGIMFGRLVSSQSLIAGIYSGGTGAIMGTMIGAISKDPSICGIPSQMYSVNEIVLFFGVFGILLHLLIFSLLCYALRV